MDLIPLILLFTIGYFSGTWLEKKHAFARLTPTDDVRRKFTTGVTTGILMVLRFDEVSES